MFSTHIFLPSHSSFYFKTRFILPIIFRNMDNYCVVVVAGYMSCSLSSWGIVTFGTVGFVCSIGHKIKSHFAQKKINNLKKKFPIIYKHRTCFNCPHCQLMFRSIYLYSCGLFFFFVFCLIFIFVVFLYCCVYYFHFIAMQLPQMVRFTMDISPLFMFCPEVCWLTKIRRERERERTRKIWCYCCCCSHHKHRTEFIRSISTFYRKQFVTTWATEQCSYHRRDLSSLVSCIWRFHVTHLINNF